MKKTTLLIIIMYAMLGACQSGDDFDKMPRSIMQFVTQYWPNPAVSQCQENDDGSWLVQIKSGPTLTFDAEENWTSVNGNGVPLPQVLLFDRLPSALYDYLESGGYLGQVFDMSRTAREITLQLHTSRLYYVIDTGEIRQEHQ